MNLFVIEEVVNSIEPRGGSSVIEINNNMLIFGGVNREQVHFNSAYYFSSDSLAWTQLTMHGDIPTPRSGHAMVTYGKYAFLFGGIDFMEELDYNDLYILDSESWEWKYVGEAGIEIKARNSHTISIFEALDDSASNINYLIIYGGASSEHGPLDDFAYALLPDKNNLDLKDIFVTWKEKSFVNSPGKREMHSTASINGKTYITGGRNELGQLLSDVWIIEAIIQDNIPDFDTKAVVAAHRGKDIDDMILKIAPLADIPANAITANLLSKLLPRNVVSTKVNAGSAIHAASAGIATV
eukprot:gene17084-22597_t